MNAIVPMSPAAVRLYSPPDVEQAYTAWHASCGPCALAAVLGVPLSRVRRLFPAFPQKPWVNPSTMWTALRLAGRQAQKTGTTWPWRGLAFLQWEGPWLEPGVPVGAAYRHTHWIGVQQQMVYDVNAWRTEESRGAWIRRSWWEGEIVPLIVAATPRATGGYYVRWSCAVREAV
jgi:hypothetical protein